jgi:hypothetical protein
MRTDSKDNGLSAPERVWLAMLLYTGCATAMRSA